VSLSLGELAPRGAERIAHGDVGVLVRTVGLLAVADHDIGAGHAERDADVDVLTVAVALVRPLDHHRTAGDPLVDAAELGGPAAHEVLERGGRLHVAKPDVDGKRHAFGTMHGSGRRSAERAGLS
jgi:hypothetical protein